MGVQATLFDRFMSARVPTVAEFGRDVADVLGARRAFPRAMAGILNWGLPSTAGLNPCSEADRAQVATSIAELLQQFEPRLTHFTVSPIANEREFAFTLDGELVDDQDMMPLTLRILSPRRGGGLGADVVLVGSAFAMSDEDDNGREH